MSSSEYRNRTEVIVLRTAPTKDEMRSLWHPKSKTAKGRNGCFWAKTILFYILFYSFLAGFFSFMMAVFYQTLDFHTPKYTGSDSLLNKPGLTFRPRLFMGDLLTPTIRYKPDMIYYPFIDSINKYLEAYSHRPDDAIDCLPSDGYRQANDSVCFFDINTINTTCSPENDWGYKTNSPCIFLKLNKMFHWKPKPLLSLDSSHPEGLQQHINNTENPEELLKQNIWVWCESQDVALEQFSPGLPLSYFPYANQKGYLAPFVIVRLLNITDDVKVKVLCRVWANNVEHTNDGRQLGEATINVLIEKHMY